MDFNLSIGIDQYIGLDQTPFAENDAKEFYEIMKNVFQIEHRKILLGSHATFKNIEKELRIIERKIEKDDRFIFFFAGHGANFKGFPHISTWDSDPQDIQNSWFNLKEIIEKINSKGCDKNLFFIDACESTIKLGSRRKSLLKYSIDELKEYLNSTSYSSVFSACSHKGIASTMPEKKHGIWSYFLLKALGGADEEALNEDNWLTNFTLKKYLNIKVKEYCKHNKNCAEIQQSYSWGKEEGEFLIMEFPKNAIVQYENVPQKSIEQIQFTATNKEKVARLSGFKKTFNIPTYYSDSTRKFINSISEKEIKDHMTESSVQLRKSFGLKRKDFKIENSEGASEFSCPYFRYRYYVEINKESFSEVYFNSVLTPYDLNKISEVSRKLDDGFPLWFDFLVFDLTKVIDIKELIDRLEENTSDKLKDYMFEYDSDCTFVELTHKPTERIITVRQDEIRIHFNGIEPITKMLEELREFSNQLMIVSNSYRILE